MCEYIIINSGLDSGYIEFKPNSQIPRFTGTKRKEVDGDVERVRDRESKG